MADYMLIYCHIFLMHLQGLVFESAIKSMMNQGVLEKWFSASKSFSKAFLVQFTKKLFILLHVLEKKTFNVICPWSILMVHRIPNIQF